ncbi:MAG: hypothetical protein KJS95_07910 [Gammaproteobacteria bacterium]|nr:hypothetical protein [Gammaproteobacteria bacterium]
MTLSPRHSPLAGTITYSGPEGATGYERFEMLEHGERRTLRALCRMDDLDLWRDVSLLLDANSQPTDAFVRVTQRGSVLGSIMYVVRPEALELEGITAEHGRVSHRIPLAVPLPYLGLHPLVGDALIALCRGDDAPGEFRTIHGYTNSSSPNGETGLLAVPSAIEVAYMGSGPLSVAAGTFPARHYRLRWQPQWPPADLWVSGERALFLRLDWELNRSRYELSALQTLKA